MSATLLYGGAGVALFALGLLAVVVRPHLLHKVLALNVAGSGIFLVFVALAYRGTASPADPVPHAMVLTGIVVAVCTTALALALALRLHQRTGRMALAEEGEEG